MRTLQALRVTGLLAVLTLAAAWPAAAQFGGPGGPGSAPDFRGVFNPVVGSGAVYQMQGKTGKNEVQISIVGKEDVGGKPGYWFEMAMTPPTGGQQMFMKNLMVIDGKGVTVSRMIIQPPGRGPMEMPANLGPGRQQAPANTDVRDSAQLVGTEDVTTPAGTFSCQHYRGKDGMWDAWLSDKVTPWGLVKSTNGDTTMVLSRIVTDAKDQITGTPQQFNIGAFGGGRPPQ